MPRSTSLTSAPTTSSVWVESTLDRNVGPGWADKAVRQLEADIARQREERGLSQAEFDVLAAC